ncbi:thiolase family protein, partial [Rhodosalinus sp.]|uniref:thiolase family protein n=1 Tax=Rhodosalinus sp. TaxID=2047741 RepID=UPI00397D26B1
MDTPEIVLCTPLRTPVGRFGGTLASVPATELGRQAVAGVLDRSGLAPERVDAAIMGNVIQAGAGMNPARQAALNGGLLESAPAMTVNRVCGSGAQAIASAAMEVALGHADCVLAGGMESMDQGPYMLGKARWGYRMGAGTVEDATLRDGLLDAFSGEHSGWHTEDLVAEKGLSREAQDDWAARSQQRFSRAQADGRFAEEIVPVTVRGRKGEERLEQDETNRPDATADSLSKLSPAFREDGTITAGNAPGLNDAAAAMLVARRDWAEAQGLVPMARLVAHGVGAVAPGMFGLGPVPAVHRALDRAGWARADLERVEINEAFAAIAIAVMQDLDLPEDIVNVE